ncbi:MAG TPA: hypothetical protein PKY22_10585, partial [Accumulibacter sp.]|nr:hypothetical protein [Accumulibacter sp.]
ASASAHGNLRLGDYPEGELQSLARSVNQLLDRRDALQNDVDERIREARASLEEERSRLAALMTELSQSVVVCNLDGRVLLYNQRAKQELSTAADGSHLDLLGLGRSIYTVFDRALIEHALERLQQAGQEPGESKKTIVSAQFVTATRAGRLLRAHVSPVFGSDSPHSARIGVMTITGFVLVLDDVTSSNERQTRRDALIQSLIEGGRGALASIRAASEMLADFTDMPQTQRDRFLTAIGDEARVLSAQFEKAAASFSNDLRERWLLEEILGAELIEVAARRIGEKRAGEARRLAVKTETVEDDLWLRVDSFGLLQALRYLAWRLQDEYQVREVRLSLVRSGPLAQFDLSWIGTFMNNEAAMSWLQEPMASGGEATPMSVTDVMERCNGEIWFQRERVSHRAFFRSMLPVCEPPKDGPRTIVVAADESDRPEFYDFDLFLWSASSHALDDTPLSELSYTIFDTETTGLDNQQAGLVGISLATAPNVACYIPVGHATGADMFGGGRAEGQMDPREAIDILKPVLEDRSILKVGHNMKYDLGIFMRHGIDLAPFDDTLLIAYALDGARNNGLEALSLAWLGHAGISIKELIGTGKNQKTFAEVPIADAARYAAEDADLTLRLWLALKPRLAA